MELNKLYYFYTVGKYQHVTRAAEELHIAQPALTKTVKQLESELGVPLFYKYKRNVRLTEFGKYLMGRLDGVFSVLGNIPEELETLKQQARKTVRLNVLAASTAVTEAIVAYKKKNENAIFQVIQNEEEADCEVSVTTNAVDFSRLPAFERRCIIEEKIYLAVPKNSALAQRDGVRLSEMRDSGFVNLAGSRLFRTICDRFCMTAGFKPKSIFESDSPIAVKNLIGAGAGVGFWPAFSWGKASSDITLLSIEEPICQRELIIGLHTGSSLSATAADFYAYLITYLQKAASRERKARADD